MSEISEATRAEISNTSWRLLQAKVKRWQAHGNTLDRRKNSWLNTVGSEYDDYALNPADEPNFRETWLKEFERLEAQNTTLPTNIVQPQYSPSEANARAATLQSWRAPFRGQTQHFLVQEIESIAQDINDLYARYLPIVQSSGTGKSRMVDESSKIIFTIPICTRPGDIPAIPPPDKSVRDFLTTPTRSPPDVRWSLLFLALFRALETSATLLDPEHCSPEGWRTLFTQDMDLEQHNSFRTQFFKDVVQIAEGNEFTLDLDNLAETVDNAAMNAIEALSLAYAKRRAPASALTTTSDLMTLNIVLDEAHNVLASPHLGDVNLAGFRLALRRCIDHPIVCTLLSTALTLQTFLPPRILDPSARIVDPTFRTPDLFHQTGWDHLFTNLEPKSEEDLAKFENMVVFGRPLFASRYLNSPDTQISQTDLVAFARAKLLNSSKFQEFGASNEQLLALLGSLVPLALSKKTLPYNVLFTYQNKLVESHLGILTNYHPHLGLVEVSRPSEPLLALAALSTLHYLSSSVLGLFAKSFELLMLSRGEMGELLSMLMFVIAHRRANLTCTRSYSYVPSLHPSSLLQPTSTQAFMAQFLRCDDQLSNSLGTLTSQMGNTRLFQFVRIEENSLPSQKQMTWAYQRGCGFACFQYQRGTDLIIPTSTGGAILVKVKNQTNFSVQEQERAHRRMSQSRQDMSHLSGKTCIQLLLNIGSKPSKRTRGIKVEHPIDENGDASESVLAITVNALEDLALLEDKTNDPIRGWFGTVSEAERILLRESESTRTQQRNVMNMRMMPLAGQGQEYLFFCAREAPVDDEDAEDTGKASKPF